MTHAIGTASDSLGLAPGARVLILNNDDFGMYHAVNVAVVRSIEEGIASSCSLMVPCPWALHALTLLRQSPEIGFGVHLTLICDTSDYRWRPLTSREKVRSTQQTMDLAGFVLFAGTLRSTPTTRFRICIS